ncbi:hypothetical protein SAMN05192564_102539 [Paraburkholderia sartisoli]|uniref:Uncharacterized protein n=1 Tax=Paraburkholderia sartisoli TaxID=83784 RepID=A0A1H4CXA6_9BURK|nr:hypothetical protein SAMN05192564_102539 [Paraburkholderia sartisoli]
MTGSWGSPYCDGGFQDDSRIMHAGIEGHAGMAIAQSVPRLTLSHRKPWSRR